jgi:hypothetical protein
LYQSHLLFLIFVVLSVDTESHLELSNIYVSFVLVAIWFTDITCSNFSILAIFIQSECFFFLNKALESLFCNFCLSFIICEVGCSSENKCKPCFSLETPNNQLDQCIMRASNLSYTVLVKQIKNVLFRCSLYSNDFLLTPLNINRYVQSRSVSLSSL